MPHDERDGMALCRADEDRLRPGRGAVGRTGVRDVAVELRQRGVQPDDEVGMRADVPAAERPHQGGMDEIVGLFGPAGMTAHEGAPRTASGEGSGRSSLHAGSPVIPRRRPFSESHMDAVLLTEK